LLGELAQASEEILRIAAEREAKSTFHPLKHRDARPVWVDGWRSGQASSFPGAAYGAAARLLLRALWWVPGGLAAALAVAMVPAVCIGFLRLIGVWSSDFYTAIGLDDNRWTSALAVLAIGLSIFVLGMLSRRYGEAWGERFVRRPPPNIVASP
jgi:hypothetical protein